MGGHMAKLNQLDFRERVDPHRKIFQAAGKRQKWESSSFR